LATSRCAVAVFHATADSINVAAVDYTSPTDTTDLHRRRCRGVHHALNTGMDVTM
jgi:hypothetical protein